jgi:hypothetical protein
MSEERTRGDRASWAEVDDADPDQERQADEQLRRKQKANGSTGTHFPGHSIGHLRLLGVNDLLAMPARDYLIKGVISPAEISLLIGAKNTYKTFVALHVDYGLAQGWATIFGRRVKQTPTLYLIAEGEAGIGKRVRALANHYGRCDKFHVVAQPIDLLRSTATQGDLRDIIAACRHFGIGKITVDTVSRALAGGDENSPVDMGTLANNLNRLRHETGAHVMGIHHGTQQEGTKSRGHSNLPNAADALIQAEWNEEQSLGTLIIGFCRDDATGQLGSFRTNVVELGTDTDGDPITTLLIEESDQPLRKTGKLAKMTDRQADLWEHLTALMPDSTQDTPTPWIARSDLRVGLLDRGWFHDGQLLPDGKIAKAGLTDENNTLTALKRRELVGFDRQHVWLK